MRDKTQTNSAAPGDRLIRAGAIVFFIGAVATLVTVAPFLLGTTPFPTYMFGLSMLMAVGFVVAGAGVLQSVAAGRRQARAGTPSGR
ncbi:preprotein translocase subunit SecY [Streptomyces sp. SAI-208]|uniref:Integral membrane protein n=1 Tax=Streptomyces sviceus (strain ATCC 29083 / DSM 924 / JCM 4929 / NBRC 13980 / NCIMB 11184 / NRRL 5439 / UC 5370) TaxID=463191 RepID=B5HLG8_STRX2|nr:MULTISPECIES: hypothetical protein [Streptomyces]EDY53673.1 integral membrane protein [Streptomyces sviceus ATCC 29083]MDH6585476.1 preprotein translocase subunit SecY [Streptomyces sp. SAI-133]MDH6609128.1 preprotein translocase subunit SecY [Streptomyces sp. SAI-208]MYT06631.1 hypothetical protein [Streptomyces sp. SID5470]